MHQPVVGQDEVRFIGQEEQLSYVVHIISLTKDQYNLVAISSSLDLGTELTVRIHGTFSNAL